MEPRDSFLVVLVLSLLAIVRSQTLGQECFRQDRTRGVCRDIRECVDQDGVVEGASMVELCDNFDLSRIIVCCRRTPALIARQKCEEWKRLAQRDGSPCVIPLVRNGTVAEVGEFPHIVSLLRPSPEGRLSHVCGGVLISRRYVLTAAHCLSESELLVRIGGHDLRVFEGGVTVDAEVITRIPHPEYKPPKRYNDIALLKIGFDVPFSKRVRPACLPYQNQRLFAGTKLVVAGWGKFENGGPTSRILRKAEVTTLERLQCELNPAISDFAGSFTYPVGITDSIICANEQIAGACSGDSGGPLMVATTATCEVKEVVGLVSRGIIECKSSNVPGTYTRIEYYLDWIVKTIWADEI